MPIRNALQESCAGPAEGMQEWPKNINPISNNQQQLPEA